MAMSRAGTKREWFYSLLRPRSGPEPGSRQSKERLIILDEERSQDGMGGIARADGEMGVGKSRL